MTPPQLTFFTALAQQLQNGTPLLSALEVAAGFLAETPLEQPVRSMLAQIRNGETLSTAMLQQPAFSREQCILIRAGEIGGVIDRAISRVADLISAGRLPAAPAAIADAAQQSLFCWSLGCMLAARVPILEAFDVAAGIISDQKLCEAVRHVRESVRSGNSIAQAMRIAPGIFPPDMCDAVARFEKMGDVGETLMRLADQVPGAPGSGDAPSDAAVAADNEVRKFVNLVLLQSVKDRATDVHFEPTEGKPMIRYRIDGTLYPMLPPPRGMFRAIVNRLKVLADMDIAQMRLPQTGRILLGVDNDSIDFRVSTTPVLQGERLVLRILRRDALVGLDATCSGDPKKLEQIRSLLCLRRGLIICAGPSGSGKTTLLYALVKELTQPQRCIITIEDPVEFTLPGVAQIPVAPETGMTFAHAMRTVLRQDPDVIVVGEIRDIETLQACVVAANTGHLVLTSIHASSAADALKRMLDAGLEPYLLNGSLLAVIAQRLARCLCPHCRQETSLPTHSLPADVVQSVLREIPNPTFYRPGKCPQCHETGHAGRTAVHEILTMADPLRQALAQRDLPALRQAELASGIAPMLADALAKAARGQISVDEALQFAAEMP